MGASGVLYKPVTRKGPVWIFPNAGSPPVITLGSGRKVTLIRGDQAGGVFQGHEGYQWVVPRDAASEVVGSGAFDIDYNGEKGTISSGSLRHQGSSLSSLQAGGKGSVGSSAGGQFQPGMAGEFGVFPADVSGMYPSPELVDYQPATTAPFKYTDPIAFAKKFAKINADQILKNRISARDTALEQLDTELKGLENFVPAASALKRRETSIDNIFNQQQRDEQIQKTLPTVKKELRDQTNRATAFAEGRVPDAIQDRALELGIRSNAADNASAGGFGAESSVARKSSDLMSAEQRINLSRYGDQLLTQNIGTRANLLLGPTEYSDAGTQVRVTPEVGGARLSAAALSETNQLTTLNPATALSAEVSQQQYATSNEQQTRLFNTGNEFAASQFNANTKNQFAMGLFNYLAGYAGAVAQGTQNDINTTTSIEQQEKAQKTFEDNKDATQGANTIGAAAAGVTGILTAGAGLINAFTPNNAAPATPTAGGTPMGISGGTSSGAAPMDASVPPDYNLGNSGSEFSFTPDVVGDGSSSGYDLSAMGGGTLDYSGGASPSALNYSGGAPSVPMATQTLSSLPIGEGVNESVTKALLASQAPNIENLGIHDTPQPQAIQQLNAGGRPVYVTSGPPEVANNTGVGSKFINTLKSVLDPTGAFTREDSTTLQQIGTAASDVAFLGQLTTLASNGDQAGFVTALGAKVAPAIIQNSGASESNKAGLTAAANAINIFTNWKNMSPAQQSLAVAQVGLQGYKFATGENIATKVIPGTEIAGTKGLTVGEGLGLLSQGYNVYGMIKNWDQLNNFQRATYGTVTATGLAQTAQKFGMLGYGTNNAAVAVDAAKLASSGFSSAGGYSVGALQAPAGSAIPAGYSQIGTAANGEVIVAPAANAASSALQYAGGAASVLAGAYTIYSGWGKGRGDYKGPMNGALGGAAMAAGLYALSVTNPAILGAVVVGGILANSWGTTGKSNEQLGRDAVRDIFVTKGLTDEKGNLTLADGSTATIGDDGVRGSHQWRNAALAGDAGSKELHSYDNDFTNPLDFFSGMQGTALTRVLTGSKEKNVDQVGRQLGNAALGNIGYGKDLSEGNFNTARNNMRMFYAKSGVSSKAQAYALANQAYAEKRIDDSELVTMHQAFNMVFDDNGFTTANKLAQGHARGLKALHRVDPGSNVKRLDKKVNLNRMALAA